MKCKGCKWLKWESFDNKEFDTGLKGYHYCAKFLRALEFDYTIGETFHRLCKGKFYEKQGTQ